MGSVGEAVTQEGPIEASQGGTDWTT